MMVTSAQLRAARAYLGWTMEKAAMACGLHRRTIIRLENDEHYAEGQPPSLKKLVALYRKRRIILENRGLALADTVAKPASAPTLNMHLEPKSTRSARTPR
jgi:transcriptional regulator with XRE-family HTH domain